MLVDEAAASDPSYGVHYNNDDPKELNVIKIRKTTMLTASGHMATAFAQVLGFTEAEMPVDKVPNGIIVLAIKALSADGGINAHSEMIGYLVLVRRGTDIETEMFRVHTEIVAEPFIGQLRRMAMS